MSLYNGPPRPGARGGRDQFNWESVKSDKDREFYLGHSVKASTGRWQKGKDLFWYTREKGGEAGSSVQDEIAAVKAREQELMMEALGLKPQSVRSAAESQLDQQELQRLLQRGGAGADEREPHEAAGGLGFGAGKGAAVAGGAVHEVMHGEGLGPGAAAQLPPPPPAQPAAAGAAAGAGSKRSIAELEEELRRQEKAAKRARKEAKKAKDHKKHKEHKKYKEHKEHKKHKKSRD